MSTAGEAPRPEVAFVGDLACPWSRIGFRRLAALRATLPLRVRWQPFLTVPHLPQGGIPFDRYLARRYGTIAAAGEELRRIRVLGASEGIRFAFARIRRQPATLRAHALLLTLSDETAVVSLAERLFEAFFAEGRDIDDPALLEAEATRMGVAWPAALDTTPVRLAHVAARGLGIEGVPTFIAGGRAMVAGAQPAEVLRALVEVACHARAREAGPSGQGRQAS